MYERNVFLIIVEREVRHRMGRYLIKSKKLCRCPRPGNVFRVDHNDAGLARGKPGLIYPRCLLRMRNVKVVMAGYMLGRRCRLGCYFSNVYILIVLILEYLAADDRGAD